MNGTIPLHSRPIDELIESLDPGFWLVSYVANDGKRYDTCLRDRDQAKGTMLVGHEPQPLYTPAQVRSLLEQQAGQVEPGWVSVPLECSTEVCCAIEREIDSQLTASGITSPMHRQDGSTVWAEALAAVRRGSAV